MIVPSLGLTGDQQYFTTNIGLCVVYHSVPGFHSFVHSINAYGKMSMNQTLFQKLVCSEEPRKYRIAFSLSKSRIMVKGMSQKLEYIFEIEVVQKIHQHSGLLRSLEEVFTFIMTRYLFHNDF